MNDLTRIRLFVRAHAAQQRGDDVFTGGLKNVLDASDVVDRVENIITLCGAAEQYDRSDVDVPSSANDVLVNALGDAVDAVYPRDRMAELQTERHPQ